VLIVDDHQLVAEAIERYLDARDGISVIGATGTVAGLARYANRPDVILMDYQLPDGTGAEATRIAKARWPRARVVMLSGIAGDEETILTVRAGADGYLTKGGSMAEVVAAVRAVDAGRVTLPSPVLAAIARQLAGKEDEQTLTQALTAREIEVLQLIGAGNSNRAIATRLELSPDTVRTHAQAVRRKLGARSRLEAVAIALRRGLMDPPGRSSRR
jgi:DNA-binding NarL/FixJ family response regulator